MPPQTRPRVSRKVLVGVVCLCLALAATLLPVSLHLQKWVEAELVLFAWWVVWVCLLAWLLYRGHDVDDDGQIRFGGGRTGSCLDLATYVDPGCGALFGEGCAAALVGVLVSVVLLAAVFLMIEFVVPAIALVLLASIGGMLARAVNDRHDCDGRFWRSLAWGTAWATVYIGPVAAIVIWAGTMLGK